MFKLRKVGGLWFWRVGRLGGSVYLAGRAKRPVYTAPTAEAINAELERSRAIWLPLTIGGIE